MRNFRLTPLRAAKTLIAARPSTTPEGAGTGFGGGIGSGGLGWFGAPPGGAVVVTGGLKEGLPIELLEGVPGAPLPLPFPLPLPSRGVPEPVPLPEGPELIGVCPKFPGFPKLTNEVPPPGGGLGTM